MLTLIVHPFITHKKAESPDDCQDAFNVNEDKCRYAIADGATRSFFPKWWAELLVQHFCDTPDFSFEDGNWKQWLVPIQQKWYERVEEIVKTQNKFYLTNSFNAKDPAVSTFIGLEVDKTKGKWQAIIIGDSCLFHKSNTQFKSYLIDKSEDFTNCPDAFVSFAEKNHYDPKFIHGEFQTGDILILATDALAKWVIEHEETGNLDIVLDRFRQLGSQDEFNGFVDQERSNENIRLVNDDVTLILISVRGNDQQGSSDIKTLKDEKKQGNILDSLFWVVFIGFLGFWACRGMYRFIRDFILTLTE
ncbi:MAG: hypothetical protein OXU23_06050 [Candidatus Poribacteria bacterium]|nr:hypothetical protein [Candidatus Poribacteria bacterium]